MQLERVEVFWLDLHLRTSVGTADGTHDARPVILVHIECDEAEGWGECGALAGGTSVDPSASAVWPILVDVAVPRFLASVRVRNTRLPIASQVPHMFGMTPVDRFVGATLEMAVLDAELRSEGAAFAGHIGVPLDRRTVPSGRLLGIPIDRSLDTLLAEVTSLVAGGMARLRLKIDPQWDVEPVREVRAAFPDLMIQVDANASYDLFSEGPQNADRLRELDAYGLACIEQPLLPADLAGHAHLAERLDTPICLDESLASLRAVQDAFRYRACGVACLKPARLGGLSHAQRAFRICEDEGVSAFVGGFFETGFARAANAALAGLPGCTLPSDLSSPDVYLAGNPSAFPSEAQGSVPIHRGVGIGVVPDQELMMPRVSAQREFLRTW